MGVFFRITLIFLGKVYLNQIWEQKNSLITLPGMFNILPNIFNIFMSHLSWES